MDPTALSCLALSKVRLDFWLLQLEQALKDKEDTSVPCDDLLAEQSRRQAAEQTLAEAQECVASNETAFSQALSEAAQAFQAELAALKGQVSLLPHSTGCLSS